MGEEHEAGVRKVAFAHYQVNGALMAAAGPAGEVPALPPRPPRRGGHRRGDRRPASVVWQQGANRMHSARALLAHLLGSIG